MFHRVGRLLQGWPVTAHGPQAALAKIEDQYAQELLAAEAYAERPTVLYTEPVLAVTAGTAQAQAPAKKKQRVGAEPLIFAEEGYVQPPAAPGQGPADKDAVRALAYQVPAAGMTRLETSPMGPLGHVLWRRLAHQGLVHAHMKQKPSVENVEVTVLEAADPVVYQVRALKAFAPGELVMVPYTPAEPAPFEDGAKWKRPRTLHPHLPFVIAFEAGAPSIDDSARFLLKSPLATASTIPSVAPAPFWAVLLAQQEGHANLEVTTTHVTCAAPEIVVDGAAPEPKKGRGKKAVKPAPLVVRIPALTNTTSLQRGEVLVAASWPALPADDGEGER